MSTYSYSLIVDAAYECYQCYHAIYLFICIYKLHDFVFFIFFDYSYNLISILFLRFCKLINVYARKKLST